MASRAWVRSRASSPAGPMPRRIPAMSMKVAMLCSTTSGTGRAPQAPGQHRGQLLGGGPVGWRRAPAALLAVRSCGSPDRRTSSAERRVRSTTSACTARTSPSASAGRAGASRRCRLSMAGTPARNGLSPSASWTGADQSSRASIASRVDAPPPAPGRSGGPQAVALRRARGSRRSAPAGGPAAAAGVPLGGEGRDAGQRQRATARASLISVCPSQMRTSMVPKRGAGRTLHQIWVLSDDRPGALQQLHEAGVLVPVANGSAMPQRGSSW